VNAHQLPDHGKDVLLVAIRDVLSANTDHLNTNRSHSILSELGIVADIEEILALHLRLGPVDRALLNAVANTEDNQTIANLLKEVLDKAVGNLHGIDPETHNALLFRGLNIIIDEASSFELLRGQFLQTVLAVEDCSDKDRVDFAVSLDEILGSDHIVDTHGL